MQKQNPFLKPTPLFSHPYPSYAPYPPPTPAKYSPYNSIEVNKPLLHYESSNSIERMSEQPPPSRYKPSVEISDILKNNPFNRPSIFTGSSANTYTPSHYEPPKNYTSYASSSYQRPSSDLYSKPRSNYNERLTPRKNENYLSTSSADSAATYINRIYDLQEDKPEGASNLNNPFLRKNLIGDKTYDKDIKSANSYDNAALKYIAHKEKPYTPSNYSPVEDEPNPYKPYKNNTYESSLPSNKYEKYEVNADRYQSKYSHGNSDKYQTKYDKYDTYENYQPKPSKYDKYDKSQANRDEPTSKKDIPPPSKYEEQVPHKEDSLRYNFQEEPYRPSNEEDEYDFNDKYSSNKYEQEMRRIKYEQTLRREQFESGLAQPAEFGHKYSFKGKAQNKSTERIPQFASSKPKEKQFSADDFETLGGRHQQYRHQPKQEVRNPAVGSKKLISSQVEEYTSNPYQKTQQPQPQSKATLGHKSKKEEKKERKEKFGSDEQQQYVKGPVREREEGIPKVLQFNGMVFYRVEVK